MFCKVSSGGGWGYTGIVSLFKGVEGRLPWSYCMERGPVSLTHGRMRNTVTDLIAVQYVDTVDTNITILLFQKMSVLLKLSYES